ncbi:MAG TPA: hypothetical protein VFZ48_01075 [Candidatus Saccharimonadales bacterium]
MQIALSTPGPQLLAYLRGRIKARAAAMVSIPAYPDFIPQGGITIFRPKQACYAEGLGGDVVLVHCVVDKRFHASFIFGLVSGAQKPEDPMSSSVLPVAYIVFHQAVR